MADAGADVAVTASVLGIVAPLLSLARSRTRDEARQIVPGLDHCAAFNC